MLITLEKAKVITREVKYIARRSHGNQIPELDQCILILLCKTYMGLVRGLPQRGAQANLLTDPESPIAVLTPHRYWGQYKLYLLIMSH